MICPHPTVLNSAAMLAPAPHPHHKRQSRAAGSCCGPKVAVLHLDLLRCPISSNCIRRLLSRLTGLNRKLVGRGFTAWFWNRRHGLRELLGQFEFLDLAGTGQRPLVDPDPMARGLLR